jgi:hypothetical protein
MTPPNANLLGHKILGKLEIPEATNGIEQPQYVAQTGLFYASLPAWKDDRNMGGVAIFDPKNFRMLRVATIPGCSPTGLAQGPGTHMLVGCGAAAGGGCGGSWTAVAERVCTSRPMAQPFVLTSNSSAAWI